MPRSRLQTVMLVDGYNVIGAWSYLQKSRDCATRTLRDRDGLEASRHKLIEALVNYSAVEGLETTIVFDAHYQESRSYCEAITQNLSVCYTEFEETADTYIEKFCAAFRHHESNNSRNRLIVATSDRAQRLMVVGYGAECMSALQLLGAVDSTASRVRQRHRPQNKSSSRFLVNSLDPKAQQQLAEWRKSLQ